MRRRAAGSGPPRPMRAPGPAAPRLTLAPPAALTRIREGMAEGQWLRRRCDTRAGE